MNYADKRNLPEDPDRVRVQLSFEGHVTRTKQEFREDCDLNHIFKTWVNGGELTHINKRQPRFGDHMSPLDYREKLNAVIEADHAFDELPATTRERFGNNPEKLLEFVADEKNHEEGIQLGLFNPKPTAEPAATPPVTPTPNPPESP